MPRTGKTTRKSISVTGLTYERLRHHCNGTGRSMSQVVEELLAPLWGAAAPKGRGRYSTKPTEGAPLTLTPPREIDDKPRKVSCFSAIPTASDIDRPKRLDIPAGEDDAARSRPAPTPAALAIAARRGGYSF